MMKIVFFGSDDFAKAHLKTLINSSHNVVACVTPPDKPKGRGMKVSSLPVKTLAEESNINVLQPETLDTDEIKNELKALDADLFVVIAYGRFLSQDILDIPKKFCVNVHSSLLPKYRGAAPINFAVVNGDEETGVTIMKLNKKMDAGEVIEQESIVINPEDSAVDLKARMLSTSPKFLVRVIDSIEKDSYTLTEQDEAHVTFAPKLTKELGRVDWNRPAQEIFNQVRGLDPWPGTYTQYNGKSLKITKAQVSPNETHDSQPGEVVSINKEGIFVATGKGALLIKSVHLESAKPMDANSFVVGHKLAEGFIFQ